MKNFLKQTEQWRGKDSNPPPATWLGAIALIWIVILAGCANGQGSSNSTNLAQTELSAGGAPPTLAVEVPPSEKETPTAKATMQAAPTSTPANSSWDFSVLTPAQRERLYKVSLTFLADTEEKAIEVAGRLNYIDKYAHPATFCGPLSIGILQQAGLVSREIDLHDFWLLNPRDDYTVKQILEKAFPREDYFWYRTTTPLNDFDFNEFPLFTGDFIYLYAGPSGTFEHMMTVTRVDEAGRVYAVSAETYSGEYAISEVMLYDPKNPETGFFYDLTNRENMYTIGLTGFGGFQIWRPITPIEDTPPEDQALQEQLDGLFAASGGEWHVVVKEIGGPALYELKKNTVIHPGSVIKVPLAMLFFEALHSREIIDLPGFLDVRGTNGRTYSQLLRAMLVDSEEPATDTLYDYTKSQINIQKTLKGWGYSKTVISPRETTAEEMTAIFEDLWTNEHISDMESEIIKGYLAEYTSGDDSRIGVIREDMPDDVKFFSKRGSLAAGRVIVAEVAVIEFQDRAYILSLFGYPNRGENLPTYEELEGTIEDAAWIIWDAIQETP